MLYVLLTILHILVCVFLGLVVLLQSGKGQDLASSFGGGSSQTVFGSAGPATALSKATTISAVIFMMTSLGLAVISTRSTSVMDSAPIPEAPIAMPTPAPLSPEAPASGEAPQQQPAATGEAPTTSGQEQAPAAPAAEQPAAQPPADGSSVPPAAEQPAAQPDPSSSQPPADGSSVPPAAEQLPVATPNP